MIYGLVEEFDKEVDPKDVDAVIDKQVNIESRAIPEVLLTRQVKYNGPMLYADTKVRLLGTKKLQVDATVLKSGDLPAINKYFPDLEDLVLEA